MRTRLLLVAAVLFSLPVGVLAQAVNRPTWTTGDTWTIRQGGDTTVYTVLGPAGDGYSVQIKTGSDTEIRHFDTNLGSPKSHFFRLRWPVEPGTQWAYQAPFRGHTYDITETVVGGDSVTVSAGSFEAVHVRGKHCYDPSTCGTFDLWYAPRVKFFVKVTFTSASYWFNPAPQELVAYQVH